MPSTATAALFLVTLAAPSIRAQEAWDELAGEYERAFMRWAQELSRTGAFEKPIEERPPSPARAFWARFEALSEQGEGRATVWLLQALDADPAQEEERAARLFERVRAAGDADWVARAIPPLVESAGVLPQGVLVAWTETLLRTAGNKAVRVAGMLAHAELAPGPAACDERLRVAFLNWKDVELGPDEPLEGELFEELAAALVAGVQEASRAWFQANLFEGDDGVYYPRAEFGDDPKDTWRPALDCAAERGNRAACLWLLTNTWPGSEAEKERLRGHLDTLASGGVALEELRELSGYVDSWMGSLGADFVEPRVRKLLAGAPEKEQAGLLLGLGIGLCEAATDDAGREKGLAILREVEERWPGSDSAERAAGKRYRFTNLVPGKPAPDFETVDADGNAFKLSDYRGKITVVDFWGFW